jgi:hypothetical protein
MSSIVKPSQSRMYATRLCEYAQNNGVSKLPCVMGHLFNGPIDVVNA